MITANISTRSSCDLGFVNTRLEPFRSKDLVNLMVCQTILYMPSSSPRDLLKEQCIGKDECMTGGKLQGVLLLCHWFLPGQSVQLSQPTYCKHLSLFWHFCLPELFTMSKKLTNKFLVLGSMSKLSTHLL